MKPRHQVTRAAIELIKRFEGYRQKAAKLPDGRWTIGYGHTLTAREGAEVSEKDAEALLIYDLIAVSHAVNEWTYTPITQNQFDALCAFAFNIGTENFQRSSVLRRVNEGQLLQAACAMDLWRKVDFEGERIVIDALVRRRSAEKALFLTPPDGYIPAPSPMLRPNVDMDAQGLVPREQPAVLMASLEGPLAVVERIYPVQEPKAAAEPAPMLVATEPATPAAVPAAPVQPVAESVTQRLQTLLKEPEAAPAPPPPANPWPEALNTSERAFVLTPPPEPEPRRDAPLAADVIEVPHPEPTLFEPRSDSLSQPDAPVQERRILIDDTLEYTPSFDHLSPEQPKFSFLPFLALGVLGLAFFAGGLFWSINAKPTQEGLSVAAMVGWLACLAGVAFFATAAYLMLGRLGRVEDNGTSEDSDA